jgi:hypothetical protein
LGGQVVTILQLYFFCARIAGAFTVVAATAAAPRPAFFKKSRRFMRNLLFKVEFSAWNFQNKAPAANSCLFVRVN